VITLKAYAHDTERLKACATILEALKGENSVWVARDKVLNEIMAICDKRESVAK
jgi:acetylornithine/succinyldiaminopimelate/putrescine aminotransferase